MGLQTTPHVIGEEWVEIPLTQKAVISKQYGNGIKYKLGAGDIDGIDMVEDVIVDSNISLRAIYGKATVLVTTTQGV